MVPVRDLKGVLKGVSVRDQKISKEFLQGIYSATLRGL